MRGLLRVRAGERGALEAGARGALLPGGRPAAYFDARAEVAAVWEVDALPAKPGRDTAAIIAAARSGAIDALVVGGVDPVDLGIADPGKVFSKPFVVSLEVRESAVTAYADVVLPVASHAEKAGTLVTWEGRLRELREALASNAMSDHRVLDMLASEMGVFLDTRTLEQIGAQFEALGPWTGAAMEAQTAPAGAEPAGDGDVILATWPLLLDAGRLQDGEPFLAGTAKAAVAKLGPALATSLEVASGDLVTVTGPAGSITVPAEVTDDMVDAVVWLPTNSAGCAVRSTLGAGNGTRVTVTKGGASL